MKKFFSSAAVSLLMSLFIINPSYAADSILSPTFTPAKNYMVGTNVDVVAAAQNPASLTNFESVKIRKLNIFYSKKSTCSSQPGDMVGGFTVLDILNSGMSATTRTVTIPEANAGLYFCAYENLSYKQLNNAAWVAVYSPRVSALVSAFVLDWGSIIPKIVVLPALTPSATPTPTETASATPSASDLPSPTGYKGVFAADPTIESPIKATIKAWNLKGNTFKSRTLQVRLCSDELCKKVVTAFDVVKSSELDASTANTFTMSAPIGPVDNFVQIVDALVYTNATLGTDKTTRTYSVIMKLISASPSASPSESMTQESQSATPVTTPTGDDSANQSSNALWLIMGILGTLLVVALVFIVVILRKKKADQPTAN